MKIVFKQTFLKNTEKDLKVDKLFMLQSGLFTQTTDRMKNKVHHTQKYFLRTDFFFLNFVAFHFFPQ